MRRGEFIVFLVILVFFGSGVFFMAHAQLADPMSFTVVATSSCALQLNWDGTTDAYDVERDSIVEPNVTPSGGPSSYFLIDSHDSALWGGASVDPIDPGDSHSYRVRAYDAVSGQYSNWVGPQSATTDALPPQPGSPASATSTVFDSGNIEISWATSSPMSNLFEEYGGFKIWLATSSDGTSYTSLSKIDRVSGDPSHIVSEKYFYESSSNDKNWSYTYTLYAQEVGGLGCDFNRSQHVVLSTVSSALTIPKRPPNFNAKFISSPRKIALTWNDPHTGGNPNETGFEIQRSLTSDFSSYVNYPLSANDELYDDTNIIATGSETYYYRIRSCIGSECSFWSPTVSATTDVPVPENLQARITYAATTAAITTLSWEEEIILAGSIFHLERATSSPDFVEIASFGPSDPERQNRTYVDEDLPLGDAYTYRAQVEKDAGSSGYSNDASVNLDLLYILKGVAWAAATSTSNQATSTGVGWIKFNSASESGSTPSSVPYSVQIDKDGLVTGNAWADVVVGDRASYGWLSFHPEDLVGCPSGTCKAEMNEAGELSGWARFIAPEDFVGESSWDGWVKLRGTYQAASLDSPFSTLASLFDTSLFTKKPFSLFASLLNFTTAHAQSSYGVQLGTCVGKECPLTGQAWGSEIVGWIGFNTDTCTEADCTVRADVVNEAPEVIADSVQIVGDSGNWCDPVPYYSVAWDYNDPDGEEQAGAEIAFVDNGGITATSTIVTGIDKSYRFWDPLGYEATGSYDQTGYLRTDTVYTPQVRVYDGYDWSEWVTAEESVTTPSHYGPYINSVVWDPDPPAVPGFATTTAISTDRSLTNLISWSWNFINATPPSQTTSVSNTRAFVVGSPATTTVAVSDAVGDDYSTCILEQTDTFGVSAVAPIKRRIFREK